MRRNLALVALAAVSLAPGLPFAHEPASAQAEMSAALSPEAMEAARVVDAFHSALSRGDTASALSLLAPDALIFEEGGAERSKAEYAAHHLAADAAFSQAVPSARSRRAGWSHGAVACITTEARAKGVYKGKAVDRLSTETMVLRRQGGRWAIVHVHWSSRAAPSA